MYYVIFKKYTMEKQVKEMHSAYTPPFMLYMRFEVEILLKYFILNFYTSSIGGMID